MLLMLYLGVISKTSQKKLSAETLFNILAIALREQAKLLKERINYNKEERMKERR